MTVSFFIVDRSEATSCEISMKLLSSLVTCFIYLHVGINDTLPANFFETLLVNI